jgi:ketosteroid isomerase-like protein
MKTNKFQWMLITTLTVIILMTAACAPLATPTAAPMAATEVSADLTDPLTLVTAYYEAIEANDIDKAMTFVSDDYVMTDPTGFTVGKEAATTAWKGYVAAGFTFDQSDFKANGNRVTSCYKVYENGNLIDQGCSAVTHVSDGKIIFDGLLSAENIWIIQKYYEALNAGDIDQAMTFAADDIVTTDASRLYWGRQKVLEAHKLYTNAGFTSELSDFSESDGRVTSCYKVMQNDTPMDRGCGGVTIVRDGKILFDGVGSLEAKYVVQRYYDAINARDLDLAMYFIASDAVFINPTGTYEGAEAIRGSLEGLVADNITFNISKPRGLDGRIIYDYEVLQSGTLLDQGTNGLTIVKDGKIVFDGTEDTEPGR